MQSYKNLSGNSGVVAYALSDDAITVEFEDGGVYLYTVQSAGSSNIAQMKMRALAGRGLSTFISRHVRHGYAAKLR